MNSDWTRNAKRNGDKTVKGNGDVHRDENCI